VSGEPVDLEAYRARFREAPFIADVGIELASIDNGVCETSLVIAPRHLQRTGQVHAGVLATMADHTAGAAAFTTLGADDAAVVTVELKLALLRPALGKRLRCRAQVIKPGRQFAFTEADVWCDDQLVARFGATMTVVKRA
jgi:uncharacterized protein (TIGR00369 family)